MLVGLQIRRGYIPLCVMPVMLDRWIDRQIDSSSAPFLVISKVPFGLQHTYPYTDSIYYPVSLNLPIWLIGCYAAGTSPTEHVYVMQGSATGYDTQAFVCISSYEGWMNCHILSKNRAEMVLGRRKDSSLPWPRRSGLDGADRVEVKPVQARRVFEKSNIGRDPTPSAEGLGHGVERHGFGRGAGGQFLARKAEADTDKGNE
ncbi:hypothetical protein F4823DRAFT_433475 [Ustulina deusta]|nr:hypothetical protein F4823DRAFT_433475 [Ustulina deusta]